MAVDLVTIHHEGAGAPAPMSDAQRVSPGGYCCAICTDGWVRFRAPTENWATLNFNHEDFTPVFLGNRMDYEVTAHDLEVLHAAFMDFYGRGEVTANPLVRAHRNSPGSSTVCPGDHTMAVWNQVVAACMESAPLPEVIELQTSTALNKDGRPEVFSLNTDGSITHKWRNPDLTWTDWTPFATGPFDTVAAFTNGFGTVEVVAHHTSRGYLHRYQTAPNNGWSDWSDL